MAKDTDKSKRSSLLDETKGIACLLVVAAHFAPEGLLGNLVSNLGHMFLPVFFLTTGYYAYGSDGVRTQRILTRRAVHIAKLTAEAALFYLAMTLVFWIHIGEVHMTVREWLHTSILSPEVWKRLFFLHDFTFIGGDHLWFLGALLYCYGILLIINKKQWYAFAYWLVPLIFAVKFIFVHKIENCWSYEYNFLMYGIPYVLTGHFMAAYREKLEKKITMSVLAASIFLGITLVFGRENFSEPTAVKWSGIFFFSCGIFLLVTRMKNISFSRWLAVLGERYSLWVYIIHIQVGRCVLGVLAAFNIQADFVGELVCFFTITACSVLGAVYIERMIGAWKNRCLRKTN